MARLLVLCLLLFPALVFSAPFAVTGPGALPEIVIQDDPGRRNVSLQAAEFLCEGIEKMTGKRLPIARRTDYARGIILLTSAHAPAALRNDPAVKEALKNTGADSYNDREAFFIRSEKDRLLLIANTPNGLLAGVVELLESVDYEVLGMGPNWIHVPDYTKKPLVFDLTRAGRPGYYVRALWPTTGQSYGVGTLMKVAHPRDEPVGVSYSRWSIGTRMAGQSMPPFPGHAMQGYHRAVAEKMLATNTTDGFLVKKCTIGPEPDLEQPALEMDPLEDGAGLDKLFAEEKPAPKPGTRPAAAPENEGELWISTELDPTKQVKVFLSDGKTWKRQDINEFDVKLDISVPMVREIIFSEMKRRAEKHFAENPDDFFIFGTDPEDGGCAQMGKLLRYPNWYPDYLKAEGVPFGQPYVLHGYNGIDQPKETWDPDLQSNTVFGFNNWLLREFDKWIDSLPAAQRVTPAGKSKKEMVRCSGYSYNYHDVPPDFNLDLRVRLMIAGYAKHRGRGRWAPYGSSHQELAKAYHVLLPREPSGDYRIISLAAYWDGGTHGIPASWSAAPKSLAADLSGTCQAGIKAMSMETDFNFGKFGLAYYLITKMLWDPALTGEGLDAIRDRWFQRAYGSVWQEMKAYYDFMLKDNYPVNGPSTWATAIRLIDAAQQRLDGEKEPAVQRRLDDLKQYWYYHYLAESGQGTPNSAAMREFAWKGQMSYMVAMHMVVKRHFASKDARDVAGGISYNKGPEVADDVDLDALTGTDLTKGPAHYTHEETQAWWAKVLEFWPVKN